MNEYDKQVQDFMDKTGAEFEIKFLRQGKYFPDDKHERDIYQVTLTKNGRAYSFEFGQSYNASGLYHKYGDYRRGIYTKRLQNGRLGTKPAGHAGEWDDNKNFAQPTAYEVLVSLTSYDPGTFEDFCGNCGYDEDSRQAEKVYWAVRDEFASLQRLFSDSELGEMGEIQ